MTGGQEVFFTSAAAFRDWLRRNHAKAQEVRVGFYKRGSGKTGITYPQALDEALCYGWIDGVRRSLDPASYMIRFTPRKPKSKWSAVNVRRVGELTKLGRIEEPGIEAFQRRNGKAGYSYEERPRAMAQEYNDKLMGNRRAWEFFQAQPPWYRRTVSYWVMSAKREETRLRRLDALIRDSAKGQRVTSVLGGKAANKTS